MNKLLKSHLELLPDELWLEIFAYTTPLDLYCAWRNLNSRINAIIWSMRINIHIRSKNDDKTLDKNVLNYFSSQIIHIKDERWDTNTSLQDCSSNLISFPNIRSLCLTRCSQEQFEHVLNYHKLIRLSLPPNYLSGDFLERYILGKDGEQRFPQLRSIGRILCPYGKNYDNSSSITNNTIIQHVHLIAPSCHSFSNFFQCLPELQSVTIDYLANDALFSCSCLITIRIRHQPNGGFSHILSKLHLSAQFNGQMKLSLLSIAACIYHVEIDFSGHCDFKKLGHILDQFSILEHVQIRVKYYSENLDLTSISGLSRFFAALTFGDVQNETGKPMLVAKWSLGDLRRT